MSAPSPIETSGGGRNATPAAGGGKLSLARRLFGIDRRSLVAFRITFGILLISDVIKRGLALEAHYTDQGVLPLAALREFLPDPLLFQAYLGSGATWYVTILFAVAGLLGLMVVVGWHAQLATLIYLWLQVSVRLRNPFANHTGDDYLTVITLFALFLPYSHHLSLDRLRKPSLPRLPPVYLSLGSAAILLQIAAFYLGAGMDKHYVDVWRNGEAVSYFANIDQYTRPLGELLVDYPGLCRFGTYFTLALEIGGPILLFSPFFTPWIRVVLVFLFASFHLGIQAVVYIGIFELLSISAALLFLPGEFWELLGRVPPLARLGRRLDGLDRPALEAPPHRPRLVPELVAGLLVSVVLYTNVHSFIHRVPGPIPQGLLNKVAKLLKLKQRWEIFADLDKPRTGWFVALGRRPGGSLSDLRTDGSIVDLWNGATFRGFTKPEGFAGSFPNHNWRRYWHNIRFPDQVSLRPYLADWLIRRWNDAHRDDPVDAVVILWIDPYGGADDPRKREPLVIYEPAHGALAANWWLPPTRFAQIHPR